MKKKLYEHTLRELLLEAQNSSERDWNRDDIAKSTASSSTDVLPSKIKAQIKEAAKELRAQGISHQWIRKYFPSAEKTTVTIEEVLEDLEALPRILERLGKAEGQLKVLLAIAALTPNPASPVAAFFYIVTIFSAVMDWGESKKVGGYQPVDTGSTFHWLGFNDEVEKEFPQWFAKSPDALIKWIKEDLANDVDGYWDPGDIVKSMDEIQDYAIQKMVDLNHWPKQKIYDLGTLSPEHEFIDWSRMEEDWGFKGGPLGVLNIRALWAGWRKWAQGLDDYLEDSMIGQPDWDPSKATEEEKLAYQEYLQDNSKFAPPSRKAKKQKRDYKKATDVMSSLEYQISQEV